jgi:hypothetical protein
LIFYCFITIICMRAPLITMWWCSTQVKTIYTTYMYVEVVDLSFIKFMNSEDNGSIMARECRITMCRCLWERFIIGSSTWHVHIYNNRNILKFWLIQCWLVRWIVWGILLFEQSWYVFKKKHTMFVFEIHFYN